MNKTKGCVLHIGKIVMTGTRLINITMEHDGFLYCDVETLYTEETYQALNKMCFEYKREPFAIFTKKGGLLKDFHYTAILTTIKTVLKVDDFVVNHYRFKLLSKIK